MSEEAEDFALNRRAALGGMLALPLFSSGCGGKNEGTSLATAKLPWAEVMQAARGQTVNFVAWAGDPKINAFIGWASQAVKERFGIVLDHVRISDTTAVVQQMLADRAAGRTERGRRDLVWINGENFIAAKEAGLLWGPFAEDLPNFSLVDVEGKPATVVDFTIPVEGYESPWGLAQLTFFADAARWPSPPRSMAAILEWAKAHPGRFTYPAPPDFVGTTFLKQALYEASGGWKIFEAPVGTDSFARLTAPLFSYLDRLHPHLWRKGRAFPPDYPSMRQLMEDSETDIAFAFNPAEAANAVLSGLLPETTRAFLLDGGTIQNAHFLAIPFNSSNRAGAMAVANFLLSPEAQARKADPAVWGDKTVLGMDRLPPEDAARFSSLPAAEILQDTNGSGRGLPEPHPTWHLALQDEWRRRYAS